MSRMAIRITIEEDGATAVSVATYDAAGARESLAETSYGSKADALAALAQELTPGVKAVPPEAPTSIRVESPPKPRKKR